jgi:hypothetical protein
MSTKSKYCEKAVSVHTISYIERYEDLSKQIKVNKDDIIYLKNKHNGNAKAAHGVKLTFKVESTHPSGLIIARRILPNGKFGPSEIVNDGPWTVEIDQTFIENVIMNNENSYDPSVAVTELERDKRKVTKYNRSISTKFNNQEEAESFMKTLSVGETIWVSDQLLHLKDGKWKVLKAAFLEQNRYGYGMPKTYLYIEVERSYRYRDSTQTYTSLITFDSIINRFCTKEEPISVEQ